MCKVFFFLVYTVVTGASEGIGRGYAVEVYHYMTAILDQFQCVFVFFFCFFFFQLARQGLNVVIMSRSEEKLQKVAEEIRECYNSP